MSNSVILKKSSQVIAWIMTIAMAAAFAVPTAFAFEARGNTSSAKWVAQTPGSTSGGATVVNAEGGQVLDFSLTVQNTSPADVFYSADALLDEPAPFEGGHELRIGATDDTVYDSIFDFTYGGPFVNNNRFTTFESGDAVFSGQNLTFNWALKVKDGIADGTYRYRVGMVQEYDAWLGDAPGPGAGGPNNNLGGRSGGTIFWDIVIGSGIATGGGNLNIGIAGTTPPDGNVAILAADVVMTKISFTASATDNALISSIAVRRTNLSADDDIADIKLYDGATKLGSTQGMNTTTHKATFTGLSWLIPAGTTKTLTIKGTFPTTADTGKIVTLGIQSASDVVLVGGGTVAGTFPAYGNDFTVGGITVGWLATTAPTSPAATNILSGSTDQDLASFKFAASSDEGFDVNSITLTEIGTSVDSDVLNMKLMYIGNQIGSTVTSLNNGSVTFTGSPLFSVKAGTNKTIYVTGDIADGVTSARTIRFEINDTPDVVAYGQNSNGVVTVTADTSGAVYAVAQGSVMTIVQGTMTIVKSSTNLAAQTYIVGEEQVEMSKFKFSAGSREGIKITKITFNEDEDAVATDYQNARLYIGDSSTPITVGGSISTTTIIFEDGNGLFEIPKSGNTEITLKVDISTAASANATFRIGIGAATQAYTNLVMYGLTSGEKIDSDSAHITSMTGVDDGSMSTHEIDAKGGLVVSDGPNTPAAANFALGTDDFEFMQFRMRSTSESVRVTSLTVRFIDDSAIAGDDSSNGATTGDVTNAKLYVWDGSVWVMLGNEVGSPSTGVASFSFDHTITKNTTDTFKVVADIPTSAGLTYLFTGLAGDGDGFDIFDEITATGVSSGASFGTGDTSGNADSKLFTKATPTITATMSIVPAARTVVQNSTDEILGRMFLTANDTENVKISTIRISADDTAITGNGGTSAADTNFSNIMLGVDTNGDGTYNLTTVEKSITTGTPDYISFSGADFNNPNDWVITKGGTLVIDIVGDIDGSSGSWSFGIVDDDPQTSLVGAGQNSGTDATIDGLTTAITSEVLSIGSGTITITAATDRPTVQQVTMSYTNSREAPTFFRIKLVAGNEDMLVDALRAKVVDSGNGFGNAALDDNFWSNQGSVRVYEGGTISSNILTGGTEVGNGVLLPVSSSDAAVNIIFDTTVTVPAGGSKYLTLVADITSSTEGADSGDILTIGIDYNFTGSGTIWASGYSSKLNVRTTGSSSGAVITTAAGSAILSGNATYIVKAQLGMAVNSASPSGTATEQAVHTIFKLNMTNTSADTDVRFRAGVSKDTDDATGWSANGSGPAPATNGTAYVAGSGAVKTTGDGTANAGEGAVYNNGSTIDDELYTRVSGWIHSSVATAAGDLQFIIDDDAALEDNPLQEIDIPALTDPDTWYKFDVAISVSTTDYQYWGWQIKANATTYNSAVITIDNIMFYNDKINLKLSSNGGLFDTDGSTTVSFSLKDGNNTLATGYYAGTGTAGLSTSVGEVTFIPTTEMAIPAGGKVYNIVVDSSALMIVDSKNLTMTIGLGSANQTTGAITAGDVMWNDNSFATTIGWVDSSVTPLTRSLNF